MSGQDLSPHEFNECRGDLQRYTAACEFNGGGIRSGRALLQEAIAAALYRAVRFVDLQASLATSAFIALSTLVKPTAAMPLHGVICAPAQQTCAYLQVIQVPGTARQWRCGLASSHTSTPNSGTCRSRMALPA
eukprot:scaffold1382_cov429-Prasinococcus_capsulatus_cf.AAC.4